MSDLLMSDFLMSDLFTIHHALLTTPYSVRNDSTGFAIASFIHFLNK